MPHTVELVTFRLVEADRDRFLAASAVVGDWLGRQPGFVSRHLAEREDGSFLDIVLWQTIEDALGASARAEAELGDSDFMRLIDPASMVMQHAEVRHRVAA